MQETIQAFQTQLKNKLQYKASSKVSPDAFLYKAFKFFDLYNNGYLAKPDFFKAIAKCGVVVDTHDMESVYKHYDSHNDGNIHYKQFIEGLLFSDTSSQNSNSIELSQSKLGNSIRLQESNPQQKNIKNSRKHLQNQNNLKESNINRIYDNAQTYPQVADLTKRILRQKQIFCLLELGNNIKNFDPKKTHKIPVEILLKELKFLSKSNLQIILSEFNHQKQNRQINYAQFIYNLKGDLQEDRLAIIQHAFEILDSHSEKQISIDKVIAEFKHSQYLEDFKKSIQLYCSFQAIDDGVFTDQDFIDFFGFLSFYFSHSQNFTAFISKAYLEKFQTKSNYSHSSNRSREFQRQSNRVVLNESNKNIGDFRKNKQQNTLAINEKVQTKQINLLGSQKKSVSRHSQMDKKSSTTSFYIKQVQLIVIRVKKRLASKGTKGYLVFEKALKHADSDNDGLVSLQEFKRVIYDLKIDITPTQATLLFDVFDPEATGLISYSELLNTLKGQMPIHRRSFFERVWGLIKVEQTFTTFANLKHCLNFRGHPDIQTGRRYDDDVFKQLQQTLLLIQDLNQTPRNQKISRQEFQQYFQNLSLSVAEDQLFESILQNFWRMISTMNIEQQYAGSRKVFDHNKKSYLMDHHRYSVKGGSVSQNAPFGTSVQPTNYFTEHHKL